MKKILLIISLFSLGVYFVMNHASSQEKGHRLIVGTNAEYPPYAFIENNQIVGFDIDVAKEVCRRLNEDIEIRDIPFDGLISELQLGRIDLIAAGLSSTEERAKRVLFTTPYLNDDRGVIVSLLEEPFEDMDSLKGKKVIVNEGYTSDLFVSEIDGLDILRLPNPADALIALKSKRADAFITAESTVQDFLKKHLQTSLHLSYLDAVFGGVSIAVSKNNPELLMQIQMILNEMEKEGTIMEFKKKWSL